jgi:hypothetical protein
MKTLSQGCGRAVATQPNSIYTREARKKKDEGGADFRQHAFHPSSFILHPYETPPPTK